MSFFSSTASDSQSLPTSSFPYRLFPTISSFPNPFETLLKKRLPSFFYGLRVAFFFAIFCRKQLRPLTPSSANTLSFFQKFFSHHRPFMLCPNASPRSATPPPPPPPPETLPNSQMPPPPQQTSTTRQNYKR